MFRIFTIVMLVVAALVAFPFLVSAVVLYGLYRLVRR